MTENLISAAPFRMVSGFRADMVSLRMILNMFSLARKHTGNPVKAANDIRKFSVKRKTIQGYGRIPRFIEHEGRYYFAEHIPGYPSSNFNSFMEGELLRIYGNPQGRPLLNTIIYSITSKCSLRCSHCFDWENIGSEEYLDSGELMLILEKLKTTGLTHIQFGGGEPLLRSGDLLNLIREAKGTMDCWLLTSGFGLTPDVASELKNAGLTGASISLDHWKEEEHNHFRHNPESFRWVREAVKNCREAGILVTLAFCATSHFVTRENVMKYLELAKDWGAGFVKILEARQTGRFRGKDIMLSPEQVDLLTSIYLDSCIKPSFSDYPIVMYPGFDQRQTGCLGAGNRYMYIDSKGEIHSCPFCHGSVGNAVSDPLIESIKRLRSQGCRIIHTSDY
jgi:MoaA/NifB/PqqE/SkfB family radical SAM enzyme